MPSMYAHYHLGGKVFKALPKVDAGLAASIFHFGEVAIPDLKRVLAAAGVPVRLI